MQRRRLPSKPETRNVRGVVTLELLVLFPILVILLLAVLEFGLIMAAAKHVAFAGRLGAKFAAESLDVSSANSPSATVNVKTQVDQYLITAGYTNSCQVILEHNVSGQSKPSQPNPLTANCPCTPVIGGNPSLPAGSNFGSVRVTVCLPMTNNVPNVLNTFGFDISGKSIRESVVWIYEH